MTKNNSYGCYRATLFASMLLILLGIQPAFAGGLSLADQHKAAEIASAVPWPSAAAAQTHTLGLQTLSIEKQEQKNSSGTRLVRIYQYHYAIESARLLILDLIEQKLVGERSIDTIHLPLNQIEIDYAVRIVAGREDVIEQLRAEQLQRQRPVFSNLAELDIKASIFEPMDPLHACAVQRCALLSLFDATRTVFSIEPVVYLGVARLELLDKQ